MLNPTSLTLERIIRDLDASEMRLRPAVTI